MVHPLMHVASSAGVGLTLLCLSGLFRVAAAETQGEETYAVKCAPCHATGLLGAPKAGVKEQWSERLGRGRQSLLDNATKGLNKMPPRGGDPSLPDATLAAAVDYLISTVAPAEPSAAGISPPKASSKEPVVSKARPKAAPRKVPVARRKTSGANAFNRLMKPPSKRNPPPTKDGIHDPKSQGTHVLQAPRTAFSALPKSASGNRVDWVAALEEKAINPRYDRDDPAVKPVIMDLNIVREVKGSMPNVVYPHEAHTQWLDCSNCHPSIFLPQKGANQISMAGILLGKQCGVCHGKVAFPVADCRRCHSDKTSKAARK